MLVILEKDALGRVPRGSEKHSLNTVSVVVNASVDRDTPRIIIRLGFNSFEAIFSLSVRSGLAALFRL